MFRNRTKTLVVATAFVALATGGGLTLANAASGDDRPAKAPETVTPYQLTPDDCIRINGGDYNACNVGNSGAGNLPYRVIGG